MFNEGDGTYIMPRMKMIEEQFMANPLLHDPNAMNRKAKDLKATKGEGEEDAEGVDKGDHE